MGVKYKLYKFFCLWLGVVRDLFFNNFFSFYIWYFLLNVKCIIILILFIGILYMYMVIIFIICNFI